MKMLTCETEVLKLLRENRSALVVNTSGGKDSDAMLTEIWSWVHRHHISSDRIYVITADLERNEWSFTLPHIQRFTQSLTGKQVLVVRRPQGDVLQMWEDRYHRLQEQGRTTTPFWSSASQRYCTSGAKRAQIDKAIIQLFPEDYTVINCIGLRAEESLRRSRAKPLTYKKRSPTAPTRNRHVYNWLPIHGWSLRDVWQTLGWTLEELTLLQEDVRKRVTPGDYQALMSVCQEWGYHWNPAYALGNTRQSCSLCVMASQSDLQNGIRWNPDHFRDISKLERRTGFSFQSNQWLSDLGRDYLTDREIAELREAKRQNISLRKQNKVQNHSNEPIQLSLNL